MDGFFFTQMPGVVPGEAIVVAHAVENGFMAGESLPVAVHVDLLAAAAVIPGVEDEGDVVLIMVHILHHPVPDR